MREVERQLLSGFTLIEGEITEKMHDAKNASEVALQKETKYETEAERELAIAKGGEDSASQEGVIKKAVAKEMSKI